MVLLKAVFPHIRFGGLAASPDSRARGQRMHDRQDLFFILPSPTSSFCLFFFSKLEKGPVHFQIGFT